MFPIEPSLEWSLNLVHVVQSHDSRLTQLFSAHFLTNLMYLLKVASPLAVKLQYLDLG